jgi:hypothetical protein
LISIGLDPLPNILPGVPGCPNDCSFPSAYRPADTACAVTKNSVMFSCETTAQAVAEAWGSLSKGRRLRVDSRGETPYKVLMPRQMRDYVAAFDKAYYVELIDFGAADEEMVSNWISKLTDDRLEAVTAAWAAELERREFVGV